jgi:hypothetical protein
MKMKFWVLIVAMAAAIAGCSEKQEVANTTPTNTVTASATQTKDEFVASVNAKMKELDAQIDALKAKSADYKDDAKVQADKALDELRKQRAVLSAKFDELKQSSQDTWDKTKSAFQSAWDDMQKAYDDTKAKFQQ